MKIEAKRSGVKGENGVWQQIRNGISAKSKRRKMAKISAKKAKSLEKRQLERNMNNESGIGENEAWRK
jgi:hypothetical protein